MGKNAGKQFEDDFKKSIPEYCFIHRLKDPPQSFGQQDTLRFSWKNPCDYYLFDTRRRNFHCIEVKSTKAKSISFENINSLERQNKMIHKHQIKSLVDFNDYDNVVPGFVFNFRDEKRNVERSYYQNIYFFIDMIGYLNKKSFNENDLNNFNAIPIDGKKKRVHYRWDIEQMLENIDCRVVDKLTEGVERIEIEKYLVGGKYD